MIGAMCLADAGVLETLKTESATICPRQPLEIIVLFMPIEKGIDDYQGGGDAETPRPASEKPP